MLIKDLPLNQAISWTYREITENGEYWEAHYHKPVWYIIGLLEDCYDRS